ncbi:unnamed protein product [Durusdinium trenchii]|uniref:EF-hand domain-containing protein n=1 Tax=Durusdinium trenchii TaxID=1381693 RepID=A0ABP0I0L0_9DINO
MPQSGGRAELPFVAVGRLKDRITLAYHAEIDNAEQEEFLKTFQQLLQVSAQKLAAGQRTRLQWKSGTVCLLMDEQARFLYCVVTSSASYPKKRAHQMLRDLRSLVEKVTTKNLSRAAAFTLNNQLKESIGELVKKYQTTEASLCSGSPGVSSGLVRPGMVALRQEMEELLRCQQGPFAFLEQSRCLELLQSTGCTAEDYREATHIRVKDFLDLLPKMQVEAADKEAAGPQVALHEIFVHLKDVSSGVLKPNDLATAMQMAGMNPTTAEASEVLERAGRPESFTFETFQKSMEGALAEWSVRDQAQQLLSCFKVFDPQRTGVLSRQTIATILRSNGNCFPEEKLEEMLLGLPQSSQGIEYSHLVHYLLGPKDTA